MQINLNIPETKIYQTQITNTIGKQSPIDNASQKSSDVSVTLSETGKNAEKKWLEIANKYDVTNISTNERSTMTGELLNNGLISSPEAMVLVAPISINHDPTTKINFLEQTRQGLDFAKNNGATQKQIELWEKSLEVLEQLNTLSSKT